MRALNPLWSSFVLAAVCSQAQGITLSEAIQSTLDNHPEVHAGANNRLSSEEELKIAKGGYLPTVDLLMGYGRQNTDSPSNRALGNHNSETVKNHLPKTQLGGAVVQGFAVVVTQCTSAVAVGILPPVAHQQIDGWQVTAFSNFEFFLR